MSKYRVLHIHTLPIIGGSGINTFLTMVGIDKNRYEVEFACAPGGLLVDKVINKGIKSHPIRNFVQQISICDDLIALWQLLRLIKKEAYDIVHTHNSKAGFIGRLAARFAKVPIIIHTIHGFAFHEYEKAPRRRLFVCLERFAARFADKLIVISEPLREWGLSLKIGKPEQYVTIYSGIEIDKFRIEVDILEKKRQLGLGPEDKVIGVVSKLWEGKGHRSILQAASSVIKKIPHVKFLFVGEGYLRRELEALTKQLGLQGHVIFTGFRSDIPEITAIFDIAILASLFEGLGRVLLEAMASGKPVIATKVGGIVDVIDDGITGLLLPPNDPDALVRAIIKLLLDDKLRERMGKASKQKIDAKFSADRMVFQIQKVYEELIKEKEI